MILKENSWEAIRPQPLLYFSKSFLYFFILNDFLLVYKAHPKYDSLSSKPDPATEANCLKRCW